MPTGVYTRTSKHRDALRRAAATTKAITKANGSEASTSRGRAAAALADFTSEQIGEAVKSNDFSLARAFLDISESINKSE